MAYLESQLDKDNLKWFANNKGVNSLKRLVISNGEIRGVSRLSIDFKYPITVFVGENGAGKSTLLALACCAFHNETSFIPQNRVRTSVKRQRKYYTYGDFFTFSRDEEGIKGIEIRSEYLTKDGLKDDLRKKKPSGKWNDFNGRPKRAVAYLGINRIVPPSESNPHRHYNGKFVSTPLTEENISQLKKSMSAIIGKDYSEIDLKAYNTYRLFEAKRNSLIYSGFNMGAGENAILGLLLEIISSGKGSLIVVDEIELGLHIQAQKRLMNELKQLCQKYNCQIICSSHSKDVLECIPPEGRVFLKRSDSNVDAIAGISPEFAFGKLAGVSSNELTVFVEDTVGESFLFSALPFELRERVHIIPAGSHEAVLMHMAVHYREKNYSFLAFLDGDQRSSKTTAIEHIKKKLETRYNNGEDEESFNNFMEERLFYLPGSMWPERVIIESANQSDNISDLAEAWQCSESEVTDYLASCLSVEKHNEFYELGEKLYLNQERVRDDLMRLYRKDHKDEIDRIADSIRNLLNKQ